MPFEQHQEKHFPKDAQTICQAALRAAEKLGGRVISSSPENFHFEVRFPKVILGKTLGERAQLSCEVCSQGDGSIVVVDAFPLDAIERKLMFGARKGVASRSKIYSSLVTPLKVARRRAYEKGKQRQPPPSISPCAQ